MNMEYLREFVVFTKHMNVTKAAQELFISQPTLSQHLAHLEKELGFALFDQRVSGHKALTPAGVIFHNKMQAVLRDFDDAIEECLQADCQNLTLHISKPSLPVSAIFARAIDAYGKSHPSTQISIRFENRIGAEPLDLLDGKTCDATTLYVFESEKKELEERCELALLRSEKAYLSLPVEHPLAAKEHIFLSDLDGETLKFAGDIMHVNHYVKPISALLKERGVHISCSLSVVSDYDEFKTMSRSTIPSIVPQSWAFEVETMHPDLYRSLPIEDADFSIDLYLAYKKSFLDASQIDFLETLNQA